MAISAAYKDLITGGVWASAQSADRVAPEDVGLDRSEGWPQSYEQIGAGKEPERTVFNELHHEITAGLIDCAEYGVPPWDETVNYRPSADAHCFVTKPSGLWVTNQNTGPEFGNETDPDTVGQQIWRRY